MRRFAAIGGAVVVALFLAWRALPETAKKTHVIRDHQTTAQLLWNSSSAYVFSGVRRDGWSGTHIEYWSQVFLGLLGRPFHFEEMRTWLVVAEIGPAGVKRFVHDGEGFHFVQPFEGAIYRQFGRDARKWTHEGFQIVPDAEAARFNARSSVYNPSYSDVDGWSSRISLLNQGNRLVEYPMTLNGSRTVVIADRSNPDRPGLKVQLAGEPTVEILIINERFRVVSAAEYAGLMKGAITEE